MRTLAVVLSLGLLPLPFVAAACSGSDGQDVPLADANVDDTAAGDAVVDSGAAHDTRPGDTTSDGGAHDADTSPSDSAAADSGHLDSTSTDSTAIDSASVDSASTDTALLDTSPTDSGPADAPAADADTSDAPISCTAAGGTCVPLTPTSCPAPSVVGDATMYTCGGGLGVECCLPPPSTAPVCAHVGTTEEGWYAPDGTLLCLDSCAGLPVTCERIGTAAQGWYTTSGHGCPPYSTLIVHDSTCT